MLECLLGGLVLSTDTALTVAVTGADTPVRVGSRPVAHGAAVSLGAGQSFSLGRAVHGARSYVAVSGGVRVEPVLGSRSTDTLSGLGPPRLVAGAVLPVGPALGLPADSSAVGRPQAGPVVLRCRLGPRDDWFTAEALATLGSTVYVVQPDSDRVAIRLDGPPLVRADPRELPSEGLVLGAVQVPADGLPLVFLNDHPTTGGYPVVAVVDEEDLGRCAHLLPGDQVRFTPVGGARGERAPDRSR